MRLFTLETIAMHKHDARPVVRADVAQTIGVSKRLGAVHSLEAAIEDDCLNVRAYRVEIRDERVYARLVGRYDI